MTESESSSNNPYLDLRRRNIQRNEAKLKELGLLKPNPKLITRTKPTPKKKSSLISVRRSSRRICRPETYEDVSFQSVGAITRKPTCEATAATEEFTEEVTGSPEVESRKPSRVPKARTETVSFPANSARSISLDINRLVCAKLGKAMQKTGKAAVMEEAARQFSIEVLDESICNRISFNKYCGVQEWSGNRIFLWVNLGGPQSDYVNDFTNEGRLFSFFGGSRMHSNSNPILKLLKVGLAAQAGQLSPFEGIVLWVRSYQAELRTFTPYFCLGRLAYVSHDPSSIPISFLWTLLDYDRLVAGKSDPVLQMIGKQK